MGLSVGVAEVCPLFQFDDATLAVGFSGRALSLASCVQWELRHGAEGCTPSPGRCNRMHSPLLLLAALVRSLEQILEFTWLVFSLRGLPVI